MTQVLENIGGEYRNRTGVHGFARVSKRLFRIDKVSRLPPEIGGTYQECLDVKGLSREVAETRAEQHHPSMRRRIIGVRCLPNPAVDLNHGSRNAASQRTLLPPKFMRPD